ncbi:MAG: hypothetical protein MJ252_16395 [archaeon]|nr:hypothetical protein [archaeon]
MNASQSRFGQSQTQMRKTGANGGTEYGQTGMGGTKTSAAFTMTNSSNAATLKGKIAKLEEDMQAVSDEMNAHKKDCNCLENEKETVKKQLKLKTHEVKANLMQELNKIEDDMKRHFVHQNNENGKLLQQLANLKAEKTALQNQLIALQRRISDLEVQVGNDELK